MRRRGWLLLRALWLTVAIAALTESLQHRRGCPTVLARLVEVDVAKNRDFAGDPRRLRERWAFGTDVGFLCCASVCAAETVLNRGMSVSRIPIRQLPKN